MRKDWCKEPILQFKAIAGIAMPEEQFDIGKEE